MYDNELACKELQADWGFSCLVEDKGKVMLFDTGAQGKLLVDNMQKLNLDPDAIPAIFISHNHWDHVGGLPELLQRNSNARVYVPPSSPLSSACQQAIMVTTPKVLSDNFLSTGELQGLEQSMLIETARGLVVVCGCAHPGVAAILKAASRFGKVIALVGGLHGFNDVELLEDLELICPCHCTQHQKAIMTRFPEKTVSGGVGRVLEFH